jgi:uncharacterized protein with PIN domain
MSRNQKEKDRTLLIKCAECGAPFYFISKKDTVAENEANLKWAMEHVTLCHDCRPHYRRMSLNARNGLPGMFGSD